MKNREAGRTLLEMTGLLCIMGLLTVGSMALYRDAVSKMRVNDLLEQVRKRALVSSNRSSKVTYGMYDQQGGGVSPVTAYGFGVADNTTAPTVRRDTVNGYRVALVPVGKIHGGQALDKATCQALLVKKYRGNAQDPSPMVGSVLEVYDGSECKKQLRECGRDADPENGIEAASVPEIICIAIKS